MKIIMNKPKEKLGPYTMNLLISLCFMMDEYNRVVSTQEDIRKELGYSPDTMTRHLAVMKKLDIIKKRGKRYIINPMYAIREDGHFEVVYDRYINNIF